MPLVLDGMRKDHHGRPNLAAVGDDRRRRLIAARFNSQNVDRFLFHRFGPIIVSHARRVNVCGRQDRTQGTRRL